MNSNNPEIVMPKPQWRYNILFFDKQNNQNTRLSREVVSCKFVQENGTNKLFYQLRVSVDKTIKEIINDLKEINKYEINFKDGSNGNLDTIVLIEDGLLNYSFDLDYSSDDPVTLKINLNVILQS